MADDKKPDEKRPTAAPARESKAPAPKRSLQPASQSSDPAVHQLIAELQTAQANDNGEEVERLTGRLADLGYE